MAGPTIRLTFAGDSTDLERSMGRVGDAAGDMEKTFSAKSAALGLAGAAAGAGLVSAFTDSLEFESAGALMEAQLGVGSPIAAAAGEAAGNLYANAYGESIGEVNDAVKSVAQNVAGMSNATAGELESVTGQMMSLAQVMEVDVGQASNAVGQMIRNGLAKDATEAMDLLAAGAQQGANRMDDLADVFAEYGETFQVAGLDGATAMGIMAQGMEAGAWSADLVADSIREFGILAQDTASTAGPAFTTLGLDAGQMAADVAAGGDRATGALDATLDALRAMPPGVDRSRLAVELFGTKAEEMGDSLFAIDPSEATARLGDFAGKAEEADAALGDTAAAKIEAISRGFQDWAMSIVGVEGPLGDVAAGVYSMGGDAIGLAGNLGMAAVALKGLGIWSGIATAAQWLWNAALSANPIGIVVLAIAALVAGLVYAWHNSETFREVVMGVWEAVKTGISNAVTWIGDAIGWFGRLPGMIGGWFGSMKDAAIAKAVELVGWVRGLPGRIGSAIGSLGSMLLNAGRDLLSGLWRGIQNGAGWLRDRIFGFFGNILPGWVKNILGIRSPSKVFADLGKHLPSGMAVGMDAGMPGLLAQATALGEATRDAAGAALDGGLSLPGLAGGAAGGGSGAAVLAADARYAAARMGGTPAATEVRFAGNTSDGLATVIMQMIRSGQIQIGAAA